MVGDDGYTWRGSRVVTNWGAMPRRRAVPSPFSNVRRLFGGVYGRQGGRSAIRPRRVTMVTSGGVERYMRATGEGYRASSTQVFFPKVPYRECTTGAYLSRSRRDSDLICVRRFRGRRC